MSCSVTSFQKMRPVTHCSAWINGNKSPLNDQLLFRTRCCFQAGHKLYIFLPRFPAHLCWCQTNALVSYCLELLPIAWDRCWRAVSLYLVRFQHPHIFLHATRKEMFAMPTMIPHGKIHPLFYIGTSDQWQYLPLQALHKLLEGELL